MSKGSRKLAVVSLLVMVPAAVTLVWLGLKLLEQDRVLWAKSEAERREAILEKLTRDMENRLSAALDSPETGPNALRIPPLSREERKHLLWLPGERPRMAAEDPAVFAEAEKQEYRGNREEARAQYEALSLSANESTKAGALLRLARLHRDRQEWDSALAMYAELVKITNVEFNGRPLSLEARSAICSLLSDAGRKESLAEAAAALEADFVAGAWDLDRKTWEFTKGEIEQWTAHEIRPPRAHWMITLAAEQLHQEGQAVRTGTHARVILVEGEPVTVVERRDDHGVRAALLLPEAVRAWVQEIDVDGAVNVVAEGGHAVAGSSPVDGDATASSQASETGLPWSVSVTSDSRRASAELKNHTQLLEVGLAAIVVLLAGGSYLLWRVIQQELSVARLQTEFVAAVSHEFRTPLASLRHVTELLAENDEFSKEERQKAYGALGRNTERLSRLVESLLDFARMEGGRKPYVLEPVDAVALARAVVEDFRGEAEPRGFSVELEAPQDVLMVEADAESLAHALWNLLDNAVKYSPNGRTVRVAVEARPGAVIIGVRDQGLGVPQKEQREIFKRFVRGAKARELRIKGTGLGLAMVAHIVGAHRGKVEVESQEGVGSTFRITLPAA